MFWTAHCFRMLCILLSFALPVLAQTSERHLADNFAGSLCGRSAYVHGYIHGYEDGFHAGDLDIHMGHQPRPPHDFKEFRNPAGYHSQYGDHEFFREGYRTGFAAAYNDALRGDSFRGIAQLRHAAEGFAGGTDRKLFDQAVATGYEAGREEGLRDPELSANPQSVAERCLPVHGAAYCDAFARGFVLGHSDGIVHQRSEPTRTAKK